MTGDDGPVSSDQQLTNNELAEAIIKVMEGIGAIGAAQAQTGELVGQLAQAVNQLASDVQDTLDLQSKLVDQCQRAIELLSEDDGRRGVRKTPRE